MVTGSRGWVERSIVRMAFAPYSGYVGKPTLVHGGAKGADQIAADIAHHLYGWALEEHQPDWRPNGVYNGRAGFDRNEKMLDAAIDLVIAFHLNSSNGTAHACAEAIRRGLPLTRYVVTDGDYTTLMVERHHQQMELA